MSKTTLVSMDGKALEFIKRGVDAIAEPVKRTFGPDAGLTLMYRTYNRGPRAVDDGFYTSEVIQPKNPFVKLVAEFFKEAIMRTNRKVGDGTTSTSIIAAALFNELYAKLNTKARAYGTHIGSVNFKKKILEAATDIKQKIKDSAKPIKTLGDLEKISAISLGEDSDLSKTIAKMAFDVGTDGFIDVVEGYKGEIETEIVKGMRFPAKVCGKVFVNKPERFEMVVDDCPVFITNHKMDNDTLARFIVSTAQVTKLILIAPDFSDQVLVGMALAQKEGLFLWPVKAPSLRTEQMEDLATFCGANLINKDTGKKLQNFAKTDLGNLERLVVKDAETREDAIALGGKGEKGEAVKERIKTLRGQLEETKEPQFKMLMERRIASMASAGGIIRVGAPSDAESLPLKLKVEDDVFACRAALRSGYVKGGGLCLKEIADELPDDHVLKNALLAPYQTIQENTGGITIGKDVIDPADAIYYAVEHATSVVSSLITVKTLIAEEPEIEPAEGGIKIAKAIGDFVLAWKRKEGIMTANEKEAYNDMNPLNEEEVLTLDNG